MCPKSRYFLLLSVCLWIWISCVDSQLSLCGPPLCRVKAFRPSIALKPFINLVFLMMSTMFWIWKLFRSPPYWTSVALWKPFRVNIFQCSLFKLMDVKATSCIRCCLTSCLGFAILHMCQDAVAFFLHQWMWIQALKSLWDNYPVIRHQAQADSNLCDDGWWWLFWKQARELLWEVSKQSVISQKYFYSSRICTGKQLYDGQQVWVWSQACDLLWGVFGTERRSTLV